MECMKICDLRGVRALIVPISALAIGVIATALAALGTCFSYKGMISGRGVVFRFLFLFFLIQLLAQIVGVLQVSIPPVNPAAARIHLYLSYANSYSGSCAFAVLVFGSFVAWGRKADV